MYKPIILLAISTLCSAKPGNLGIGLGHEIGINIAPAAFTSHAIPVVPVTVDSAVSSQSRIDLRTPVVANVAVSAPIVAPVAVTSHAIGYADLEARSLTHGGIALGSYGFYGHGLALGH